MTNHFASISPKGIPRATAIGMTHHLITSALAISGLLALNAAAQNANRMETPGDQSFATKAAQGGMAEVELGRLATERATNNEVKQFGQRMIDDHTKANDQLKSLASSKGMNLPTSLNAKDEATKNHLSTLSGPAFDRAYMEDMVSDHRTDISEFEHEANHGSDPQIKNFAETTLPTLREHIKLAEQTLANVKRTGQ